GRKPVGARPQKVVVSGSTVDGVDCNGPIGIHTGVVGVVNPCVGETVDFRNLLNLYYLGKVAGTEVTVVDGHEDIVVFRQSKVAQRRLNAYHFRHTQREGDTIEITRRRHNDHR